MSIAAVAITPNGTTSRLGGSPDTETTLGQLTPRDGARGFEPPTPRAFPSRDRSASSRTRSSETRWRGRDLELGIQARS